MKIPFRTIETDLDEITTNAGDDLRFFDAKRVLVTGGAGFLLSYLVEALVRRARDARAEGIEGPVVVVADTFTTGDRGRLAHLTDDPAFEVREFDVTRRESIAKLGGPFDVVVHGASIASPPVYRAHPLETIEANAIGTLELLRAFATPGLSRFVLMSSSEIYGDPDPRCVPTPETYEGRVSCTGPRACYDESKRLAETIATTFHRTHRTPVRIVRPFNVFGPGMRLDDGRVVPSLVRDAIDGRGLVLHSDGTPRRSFCYVTDFTTSLLRVIVGGEDGEAYNVGDDTVEIPMRELAERIRMVSGTEAAIAVQPSADSDYLADNPQRRCPDLRKLRSVGGGSARVSLDAGLARYVEWARESLARDAASVGRATS